MGKRKIRSLPGEGAYAGYSSTLERRSLTSGCKNAKGLTLEGLMNLLKPGESTSEKAQFSRRKVITIRSGKHDFLERVHQKRNENVAASLRASLGSDSWRASKGLDNVDQVSYSAVEHIHNYWVDYSQKVLKMCRRPEEAIHEVDFHGALLQVVKSRNPQVVGFEGLVLKDDGKSYLLIQRDGHRVRVWKNGSCFAMKIGDCRMQFNGSCLKKQKSESFRFQMQGVYVAASPKT